MLFRSEGRKERVNRVSFFNSPMRCAVFAGGWVGKVGIVVCVCWGVWLLTDGRSWFLVVL